VNTLEENSSNEHLSQETPEVQEKLLDEILNTEENQENDVSNQEILGNNQDNLLNEIDEVIMEEPVDTFNVGDKVKLKPGVGNDMVGRRIHNGVKNYVYTVHNVRSDGYIGIECLTHYFIVSRDDIIKK
jgi:hypothetical protein